MRNFKLELKTVLHFGQDSHKEVGKIIKNYGFRKVLILYGSKFAIKSGLLELTTSILDSEEIDYVLFGGITPNPEAHFVRESRQIAREFNVDLILAIGGGSVIDVAKALAVSFNYEGDPLDFSKYLVTPSEALPIGVILTHASAGSEMSPSCVISEAEHSFKQGFRTDLVRPLFAITNPALTYSLSPYQTAVGIVDSFMHSLERYFNISDTIELSDRFAEGIFITLKECAEVLIRDPQDETARANLMLASTFSHNDVTSMGKKWTMPAHSLEHAVSALYPEVAHGHGLAVIYPAWLNFYFDELKDKLDRFGRVVFNLHDPDIEKNAREAIIALSDLFIRLGLTMNLRSFGVKEDDIDILANIVTKNGTKELYHTTKSLSKNDIIKIYENCF